MHGLVRANDDVNDEKDVGKHGEQNGVDSTSTSFDNPSYQSDVNDVRVQMVNGRVGICYCCFKFNLEMIIYM